VDASFPCGRQAVVLTYVAGWYAATASVDPQVKTATQIVFAHLWRAEHGSGNQTFGTEDVVFPAGFAIPRRALELLGTKLQNRILIA
jgi:hypothetical protein